MTDATNQLQSKLEVYARNHTWVKNSELLD
jgi:hypothetical protein